MLHDINEAIELVAPYLEILVLVVVILHIIHGSHLNTRMNEIQRKLNQVIRKVNELERAELLNMLVETAQAAKKYIYHYTFTFHTPDEEAEMGDLLNAIQNSNLTKNQIRFLGPDHRNNVNRLYLRVKAGADVRINEGIKYADFRFQVIDGNSVVVTIGSASKESRQGFRIDSLEFAEVLTKSFEKKWKESTPYEDYVCRIVIEVLGHSNLSGQDDEYRIRFISEKLQLEIEEVRRVYKKVNAGHKEIGS